MVFIFLPGHLSKRQYPKYFEYETVATNRQKNKCQLPKLCNLSIFLAWFSFKFPWNICASHYRSRKFLVIPLNLLKSPVSMLAVLLSKREIDWRGYTFHGYIP